MYNCVCYTWRDCRPGGDSRELWQALAVLYKSQGRPDLSLAVYLQLQLPSVFDFIQVCGAVCSAGMLQLQAVNAAQPPNLRQRLHRKYPL